MFDAIFNKEKHGFWKWNGLESNWYNQKYGAAKALDKVSIEIKRGMIYGLIGENGAGIH